MPILRLLSGPCNDTGRASCSRCLVGDNPQGCLWCSPPGGGGLCIDSSEEAAVCANSTVNTLSSCDGKIEPCTNFKQTIFYDDNSHLDAHKKKGNLALWLWILLGCLVGLIILTSMCIVVICICCAGIFGIRYGESRALLQGGKPLLYNKTQRERYVFAYPSSRFYQALIITITTLDIRELRMKIQRKNTMRQEAHRERNLDSASKFYN